MSILVVFGSDAMRHTFVFYLGITLYREVAPGIYEYHCPGMSPLWIAVASQQETLSSILQFAFQRRLNVHNYTRHGIMGPGGLQTVQQWLGNTCTVRQRYGDEVAWFIQRELPGGGGGGGRSGDIPSSPAHHHLPDASNDADLERVLARSLEAYAEEMAGRRSPCPGWVESLRRFKSEPAVPGVDPLCRCCLVSRATVALADCGHQAICDECACAAWSQSGGVKRQCLVCRKPIQQAPIHLFPSEPIPVNKNQQSV